MQRLCDDRGLARPRHRAGDLQHGAGHPRLGRSIAHEARAVEGGYRVTARWDFASGSRQASWLGAHVRIVGADGTPRKNADGSAEVRTILFPIASAVLHDVWQAIGLAGTGTDSYEVADLFVPERFTAFRDVPSALREQGPLYRIGTGSTFSLGFAAVSLGVARATLDAAIALARGKHQSLAASAMHDNPAVQGLIGRTGGRPAGRARLSLCDRKRDVARSLRDRRVRRGASELGSPRRDLDHSPIGQGGRHRLSHGRRDRRIPQQSVRAPLSRHARHRPADPGARHALRGCR
ncbi:alkylation response protein AidB-like acyl-CoA dehydrogenase [Bradyrhizobium sp. F1.13.1]